MIACIEFSWNAQERMVDLAKSDAVYQDLCQLLPNAPNPDNRDKSWAWQREAVIELETDGQRLLDLGLNFEVKKFKGTMPLTSIAPGGAVNNVYVQVPHVGLLAIDEVCVEEDVCTDLLQRRLDEGWRILCVCPPNAARRPDYILGRTKERP